MNIGKCTKCVCLLLSLILVLALFGCGNAPATTAHRHTLPAPATSSTAATTVPETKNDDYTTFTTEHFRITLPRKFREELTADGRISFYNGYVIVLPSYELFSEHPSLSEMTLEEYGQKLIESRNFDTTLSTVGGIPWFEYRVDDPNGTVHYTFFVTLYKTDTAFWIIEYISDSRTAEHFRVDFLEWAETVEFLD